MSDIGNDTGNGTGNDTGPDTTRLRELLSDLAEEIQPDLDQRAAEAIKTGRRGYRIGGFGTPLVAAAVTLAVVGLSYFAATAMLGTGGSPVAGSSQTPSATQSPSFSNPELFPVTLVGWNCRYTGDEKSICDKGGESVGLVLRPAGQHDLWLMDNPNDQYSYASDVHGDYFVTIGSSPNVSDVRDLAPLLVWYCDTADCASTPSAPESSPTTASPSPEATKAFVVVDRQSVDVDGDGEPDRVTLLDANPKLLCDNCKQELKVALASGATTVAEWPMVAEGGFETPLDLDGDGDVEIIVGFGGGESAWMQVFDVQDGHVSEVATVSANGSPRELSDNYGGWTDWHSVITADPRLIDYRATSADPGAAPFTVQFRTWTMSGLTLTRSSTNQTGCLSVRDNEFVITPGAC